MSSAGTVTRLLLRKHPLSNVVLIAIMATVLFLAGMLTGTYSVSTNILSCYRELSRENVIFFEAEDAPPADDPRILSVYAFKRTSAEVEGRTAIVRYFSRDYLSRLDGAVNRGKWFDGASGTCVTTGMDVRVGSELTVEGRRLKVVGTIKKGESFPVMNVYSFIPAHDLSVLWDTDGELPGVLVSADTDEIEDPTHYAVRTDAPVPGFAGGGDFVLRSMYRASERQTAYACRVLTPLLAMAAVLAVLAITVTGGIIAERDRRLFLVFSLYGGGRMRGYLCGAAYLTVLAGVSAAAGITVFLLAGNMALNAAASTKIALAEIAAVALFYVSFTVSFATQNIKPGNALAKERTE